MNIQKTGENELESNGLQTVGQTRTLLIVVSCVLFAGQWAKNRSHQIGVPWVRFGARL